MTTFDLIESLNISYKEVLKLILLEGITNSEFNDIDYMQSKIDIWIDNGLLTCPEL